MKNYEFWFIVGSQTLYGPEVLETVDARAMEMAAYLTERLPYPLVYKGTAKSAEEIPDRGGGPGQEPAVPFHLCG